jgi:hypothetical protein
MVSLFKCIAFIILLLSAPACSMAQDIYAANGSSLQGSLSVLNNPASIVNSPTAWDLTFFSVQLKYGTNAVKLYNYSLLSSAVTSEYQFSAGDYSRYALINANTNILNTRIALNRQQAICFGLNLRSYSRVRSAPYNYIDTIHSIKSFLKINPDNRNYQEDALSSSWIEIFGTYAATLLNTNTVRLNAGITGKVMRGISGAFENMDNTRAVRLPGNPATYKLQSASAVIAYSSNYDTWKKEKTGNQNAYDFLSHTEGGFGFDIGIECLVKDDAPLSFEDEDDYYNYRWKIGMSILDIGKNNYNYANLSSRFTTLKNGITDSIINAKLRHIHSLRALRDSVAGLSNFESVSGTFSVKNPMRLVINADRYISGNFFLNADISLNLSSFVHTNQLQVKESNLFRLVPRWEKQNLGFYMPFLYDTDRKLWIGGAVKIGPLIAGIHNWANIFSKDKMQNGGGYLAFCIHPGSLTGTYKDKRYNCPSTP